MFSYNNKEVKSNLFEGVSLVSTSLLGFYKNFTDAIKKADIFEEELKVPKIIVIGAESSGKSSLLENIVKCQLFPKNTTFCTKTPIHLILKCVDDPNKIKYCLNYKNNNILCNKTNIYIKIKEIMDTISDISDDEILIEIHELQMINFEFYDLPGIRAYPPDMELKTTTLANKYLQMDNVIPICVIPATTPRITSYIPLALIKNNKKEHNTILCLTMCDRLQEENIEELLINRLINNTDEFLQDSYVEVCAVINRTHKNNIELCNFVNTENDWYKNNIYTKLPLNYKHTTTLHNKLGATRLINVLSNYYKKYVENNWIPDIIQTMNTKLISHENELELLGFDPSNEKQKSIFEIYVKDILYTTMIKNLYIYVELPATVNYVELIEHALSFVQIDNLSLIKEPRTIVNGKLLKEPEKINFSHFSDKIRYTSNLKINLNDELILYFHDSINEFEKANNIILNLQRFSDFLIETLTNIENIYDDYISALFQKFELNIKYDFLTLPPDVYMAKLKYLCHDTIYNKLRTDIRDTFISELNITNLQESNENKINRKIIQKKILKLNEAINDINIINQNIKK
jgi:hypothetical protein